MKLHMLGIPHTVTRADFSHCAFTMKVKNFSPMMRAQGFEVVHYGNEGSESGATEDVTILETEEHLALLGLSSYHERPRDLVGVHAYSDNACYRQFNHTLRDELLDRVAPGDVICLPFGAAHDAAVRNLPLVLSGQVARIESGIGYPRPQTLYRVYESEAWRHWILGQEQREGMGFHSPRGEWVIPNYYNLDDWPLEPEATRDASWAKTVVFFGRIEDIKGVALIPLLAAARPDLHFRICGQGDPTPYVGLPNVEYVAPISGRERAAYLGRAAVALFPSRFVEPFCGAAVESMLCGTPVLTSDFGAFTETVTLGVTGYRCGRIESWLEGLDRAMLLSRSIVAATARARYALPAIGAQYAETFHQIARAFPF